jgi:hypothetical protein
MKKALLCLEVAILLTVVMLSKDPLLTLGTCARIINVVQRWLQ